MRDDTAIDQREVVDSSEPACHRPTREALLGSALGRAEIGRLPPAPGVDRQPVEPHGGGHVLRPFQAALDLEGVDPELGEPSHPRARPEIAG